MSNSANKLHGREDNTKKLTMHLQDDENSMMYRPGDMANNKFFGTWSKLLTLSENLNFESSQKYFNDYESYFKARCEIGSSNVCFDECVHDVNTGAGLNSEEKNCIRECYLKRVSSRDDLHMLTT